MGSDKASRKRAAKKAARTRAVNRAIWQQWETVHKPSLLRVDAFLNALLNYGNFDVRWNPLGGHSGHKLQRGVTKGRLVKFMQGGKIVRVKPDGYKRAHDYPIAFWEPIL